MSLGPANWRPIAIKDVQDAIRSRFMLGASILLVVLFGGIAGFVWQFGSATTEEMYELALPALVLIIPLFAIVLGYKSVIGERHSRTIVLLLSFPHSRRDLAIGTFIGRAIVITTPIVVALTAAAIVGVIGLDSNAVDTFAVVTLASILLAGAFLGIAMGLSMVTNSMRRVTAGGFGAYLLLVILYDDLVQLVWLFIYRFQSTPIRPNWSIALEFIMPVEAYSVLVASLGSVDLDTVADHPQDLWFITWWTAVIVLLIWTILPAYLGYRRFTTGDLI